MYAALLTKSMCSETCIPSHTSCMSNKAGYGDDERIYCQIHLAYIFADEFWKTLSHNDAGNKKKKRNKMMYAGDSRR